VWQRIVAPFIESGALVVVGVVQEQHPDRARLYRQWRDLQWPIFVDSLNLLDLAAVPIPVAIDAAGIVRHEQISPRRFEAEFMSVNYNAPNRRTDDTRAVAPDLNALRAAASAGEKHAWRAFGDECFLQRYGVGDAKANDSACDPIHAFQQAVKADPENGRAHFRLGVAYRARYDSDRRQPNDAQAAVHHWGRALGIDPNQYIWRRRLQQYGPRLDKPYNFYFWVNEARVAIRARGETPVPLTVEPSGSELEPQDKPSEPSKPLAIRDRFHKGRIKHDDARLIDIETVVTPDRVRPGRRVRVRTTFRVNARSRPYWNNEADPLIMWVELPDTMTPGDAEMIFFPNPEKPETQEERQLELELMVTKGAPTGLQTLAAHALYYVCEKTGGKCRFLRQDFSIPVHVDPAAPTLR